MHTYEYLKQLVKDINANNGSINCGHCALRFDSYVAVGKNLGLEPVPVESAHLYTHPYFKDNKITQSITKDKRFIEKSGKPNYRTICDLTDPTITFEIDLTDDANANKELRFLPTTPQSIINTLQCLPRRKKDESAYGFIVLTHKDNYQRGHIMNYFVDKLNNVYFIDAQEQSLDKQITPKLDLKGYRAEIFYLPSKPPEGYKIKNEKTKAKTVETKPSESDEKEQFNKLLAATKIKTPTINDLVELALCYTFGIGTERNLNIAIGFLKDALAINDKHAPAWLLIGGCYELQSDLTLARNAYEHATLADKDYIPGWVALGKSYQMSKDPHELNKAKDYFEIAAKINKKINLTEYNSPYLLQFHARENILALHLLAQVYKNEKGFAFSCYQLAADLGVQFVEQYGQINHLILINTIRQAWKYLSHCYKSGYGTTPDTQKANEWSKKYESASQPQITAPKLNTNENNNNAIPAKATAPALKQSPVPIFVNPNNPLLKNNTNGPNERNRPEAFLQTQLSLKEQEINLLKQENEILRKKLALKEEEIENLKGKEENKENQNEVNLHPKKQRLTKESH
jgi:hypothetical protein